MASILYVTPFINRWYMILISSRRICPYYPSFIHGKYCFILRYTFLCCDVIYKLCVLIIIFTLYGHRKGDGLIFISHYLPLIVKESLFNFYNLARFFRSTLSDSGGFYNGKKLIFSVQIYICIYNVGQIERRAVITWGNIHFSNSARFDDPGGNQ